MSAAKGGNPERDQMQDFLHEADGAFRVRMVASSPTLLLASGSFTFFSLLVFSCGGGGNERQPSGAR